ncbi:hypothetical protein E2C01_012765 [Portunus trituberculatus]|uniref:Uncharacterized protein n=1 Tax=Portunus trituberculatus TaxID=210409 RepID=A0A5B7DFK5_PORTR|nr:hypothetical protein [Portunus trituberculatus]
MFSSSPLPSPPLASLPFPLSLLEGVQAAAQKAQERQRYWGGRVVPRGLGILTRRCLVEVGCGVTKRGRVRGLTSLYRGVKVSKIPRAAGKQPTEGIAGTRLCLLCPADNFT